MFELLGLLVLVFLLFTLTIVLFFAKSNLSFLMISSIFSSICVLLFYWMDALDVALTEIVVGSITGLFILIFLHHTQQSNAPKIHFSWQYIVFLGLILIGIFVLFLNVDMLYFLGQSNSVVYQSFSNQYYLNEATHDIPIPNIVTKILASYRGYDTLGETVVIFSAGLGVLSVLDVRKPQAVQHVLLQQPVFQYFIVRLLPLLLLLALYVQFHGEYSPGGGFQAGAILASVFLMFYLFLPNYYKMNHWNIVIALTAIGVLLYGFTGVLTVFLGGEFLDYNVLFFNDQMGQKIGIFLVEFGVFVTVYSVLAVVAISLLSVSKKSY